MQLTGANPSIIDENGEVKLVIPINNESKEWFKTNAFMIAGEVNINIERKYPKRSINANAMFWALCGKIAAKLGASNQDVYVNLLQDYGSFEVVNVPNNSIDEYIEVLKEVGYKYFKNVGSVMNNGAECAQFLCFRGSSTYNTAQMARLIEGAIMECENLGISHKYSKDEVGASLEEWSGGND